MRRSLEIIHRYGSVIPFLSMVFMLMYILIARISLGYFPTYGSQPDPSAFGYFMLEILGFIFFLLSVPVSITWLVATLIGIITYRKSFTIKYSSILIYSFGVGSFFIMKYCFTSIFLWYMD